MGSAHVPIQQLLLCLLESCGICECDPPWLSELGGLETHPSGIRRVGGTRCVIQTLCSQKDAEIPPNCEVRCQGWGLWREYVSAFLTRFDVFSPLSSVQESLNQFLNFSQRELIHVQLYIQCIYGRRASQEPPISPRFMGAEFQFVHNMNALH